MNLSKMTLREMKSWLEESSFDEKTLESFLQRDGRKGARELIQKRLRFIERKKEEDSRLERLMQFEREHWNRGLQFVAGVDEAGRGPLAGPVVAAAVILPVNQKIYEARDSKQLSPQKREQLYFCIKKEAVCYSLGIVDVLYIDQFNIYQAGLEAMRRALIGLEKKPQHVLIDAFTVPGLNISQTPLVKGDNLSLSIACASILAKVTRDKLMEDYHRQYPQYGFAQHKGYGTAEHYEAIKKYGISPIHRRSFRLETERGNQKPIPEDRKQLGDFGEEIAKKYLIHKGYTICHKKFRCPLGEIDLIAKNSDDLVFIEVKTRRSLRFGEPFESIDSGKQKKMIKLAQYYMSYYKISEINVRFDVVSLLVDESWNVKEIKLIQNAFF